MPSAFGWLDTDNEQRRKMLEVVDLFKEEGTVDELGIGSIRDALADALFPGTSVLLRFCPIQVKAASELRSELGFAGQAWTPARPGVQSQAALSAIAGSVF